MDNIIFENRTECPLNQNLFLQVYNLFISNGFFTPESKITLIIADSEFVKNINKKFRGVNNYTDIISFPDNSNEEKYVGDIIIDLKTVVNNKGKNDLESELSDVFIHGLLHLAGFDHLADSEADKMEAKEIELKEQLKGKTSKWSI